MDDAVAVPRRLTWIWLASTLLMGSCGAETNAPPAEVAGVPESPGYVTGAVCATCHEREATAWAGSDHDLAMAHATPETVRGDFDGAMFTHDGVQSRFFREQDRYYVETEGPTGDMERFEVAYTFGIRPLQQYLVELPGGRLQALTTAWDTQKNEWYSLHPDERIRAGDPLHWTGRAMNWNHMCASCHSTGLEKNFDVAAGTYQTTWSEIDVSCESCHGPGEAHVEWARRPEAQRSLDEDYHFVVDLDESPRAMIETCAPCHSRRRAITETFQPGDAYLDHYVPALIDEQLYFPDGQIKDEVYVYGSFLQSKMYQEGVTCTDCHDPHTARLKLEGNALCTQCHAAETFDVPAHLNHAATSAGAQCVNCHMPERTYMGVDPRRDHSFKVPRPDLTLEIGVPNACNTCHTDRPAAWARDRVARWYGPNRSDSAAYGRIIAAARQGDPAAEEAIVSFARAPQMPAMLRATVASLLAGYRTRTARDAVKQALQDREPLVRVGAVRAMEDAPDQELYAAVTPLLADSVRAVRIEAARVLTRLAHRFSRSSGAPRVHAFWDALAEYRESQRVVEDQPEAHLNLAVLHEQFGEWDQAENRYRTALRLDSTYVPAHLNLAMLLNRRRDRLRQEGRADAARALYSDIEQRLRTVLVYAPELGEAHYTLGLLLAEDAAHLRQAVDHLHEAARLRPQNARIQYNTGLAYQHLGQPAVAERFLLEARRLGPDQPDYLYALAVLHMQQQQWNQALGYTDSLLAASPPSPELQRQRTWIHEQMQQSAEAP